MSVSSELHRLLYRIAQAYDVDGLTQKQIASRFGLSRPKVSRLLQRGRDNGVISISLLPPPDGTADLERELEHRYGLQEAVVVPVSDPEHLPTVVRELGPAAAECLIRSVSGDEVIATAWGTSILAMTLALPYRSWPGVTVVQLLGGLGPADTMEHSAELTQHLARKLGAKVRLLPAPGLVATREMAEVLKSDDQISAVLELAAEADIAAEKSQLSSTTTHSDSKLGLREATGRFSGSTGSCPGTANGPSTVLSHPRKVLTRSSSATWPRSSTSATQTP